MLFDRPTKAIFELTNRCNLKCRMCGIWSEPEKHVVGIEKFREILHDPELSRLRVIALTGGEPFLIQNLDDYYAAARARFRRAHINISTNGYLTEKIVSFLQCCDPRRTSITISYDGAHSHDKIRRVEGSGKKLKETAAMIKERFPSIPVSLKLTITPENYDEILATAEECRELGVPFRFKTMEKIKCHQNRSPSEIDEPDYTEEMLESIKEQSRQVLRLGVETNRRYIKQLLQKYSGGDVGCNCSSKNVFIGVDGQVFLCRKEDPIGNIFESSFGEIWRSGKKKEIIGSMRICGGRTGVSLSYIND